MKSDRLIPAYGTQDRGATAALLLAMAEELGLPVTVVKRARDGYLVPAVIADQLYSATEPKVEEPKVEAPKVETIEPKVIEVEAPKVETEHDHEDEPEVDRETIRAWAKDTGREVADKGRLSKALIAEYMDEHAL